VHGSTHIQYASAQPIFFSALVRSEANVQLSKQSGSGHSAKLDLPVPTAEQALPSPSPASADAAAQPDMPHPSPPSSLPPTPPAPEAPVPEPPAPVVVNNDYWGCTGVEENMTLVQQQ
jgi:hypothetical protein